MLRIIYYAFMNLLLLVLLFQAIGELGLNYAETSHRLTMYKRMEPNIFSRKIDQLFAFFLPFLLVILQFLIAKRPVDKDNKFSILSSSLLLSSAFISRLLNLSLLSLFTVILSTFLYLKINNRFKEYATYTIAFLIVLETLSLVRWLTYPFIKTDFYEDYSWIPSKIDKHLSDFFNTILSPFLITILMFSWIISLLVKLGSRIQTIKFKKYGISLILKRNPEDKKINDLFKDQNGLKRILFDRKLAFSSSLILLFYLTYYSYIPSINPSGTLTNVDTAYYAMFLEKFESLGLNAEGINYLLKDAGNRPVVILTLFFIKSLSGLNPLETVKLSYFIAGFLLVLSTYYSIKIATKNEALSVTSIYFTTFSITTVVGLYAGYLGNWMAASFLILMASFFYKAVRDKSFMNLVPATVFSALALYSHPWSWFIFVLASFLILPLNVFLKYFKIQETYDKQRAGIVLIFTLINLFLDFSKQSILSSAGGFTSDYALVQKSGIYNIFMYSRNLDFMLKVFVGGFTNNYIIFIFSIVGITFALKYDNQFLNLLLMLSLVTSPAFIMSDHVIQSRIIYLLPLHIFSAIGFLEILSKLKNKVNVTLLFILVILLLANYSFRSVANLI